MKKMRKTAEPMSRSKSRWWSGSGSWYFSRSMSGSWSESRSWSRFWSWSCYKSD
jgi:hypothetical protein